jgi:hypothetical protein
MRAASTDPLPGSSEFVQVLESYAKHFPYDAFATPRDLTSEHHFLVRDQASITRFLPLKADWIASELLVFEGEEFAQAAARALRRRTPTEAEIYWLSSNNRPWARLEMLLQMDRENRKERTGTKLYGMSECRLAWGTSRWLEKRKMHFPAKIAHRIFRKLAKRKMLSTMADVTIRQMLLLTLHQIEKTSHGNSAS